MNQNPIKLKTELMMMFMRTCHAHLNKQKEPGRPYVIFCKSELTLMFPVSPASDVSEASLQLMHRP